MGAAKLIFARVLYVLKKKFAFRLRYAVGFVAFMLIFSLVMVLFSWLIDAKYWDELKSDQFIFLEDSNRRGRPDQGK